MISEEIISFRYSYKGMQISMCALDVEQGLTQAGAVEVVHTVQRGVGG